jgi:hypothetical protein
MEDRCMRHIAKFIVVVSALGLLINLTNILPIA